MIKNWNWTLTFLAVANALCIWWLFDHYSSMGQGMGIIAVIVLPIYVLVFSLLIIVLAIVKRKTWFKAGARFSSVLMMVLCTPIPLLIYLNLSKPSLITREEGSALSDDRYLRTETDLEGGRVVAIRHWIRQEGDADYLKDSTWVYFNHEGDTASLERFERGILMFDSEAIPD